MAKKAGKKQPAEEESEEEIEEEESEAGAKAKKGLHVSTKTISINEMKKMLEAVKESGRKVFDIKRNVHNYDENAPHIYGDYDLIVERKLEPKYIVQVNFSKISQQWFVRLLKSVREGADINISPDENVNMSEQRIKFVQVKKDFNSIAACVSFDFLDTFEKLSAWKQRNAKCSIK